MGAHFKVTDLLCPTVLMMCPQLVVGEIHDAAWIAQKSLTATESRIGMRLWASCLRVVRTHMATSSDTSKFWPQPHVVQISCADSISLVFVIIRKRTAAVAVRKS